MLGVRGWSHVTGSAYARRLWLEAGNGGEGPYGYSSAIDWDWEIEIGDTVTHSNGLTDTIVSVIDPVSHVIGRLSYDAGHISAWTSGFATVTREIKPRATVDFRGPCTTRTEVGKTIVTAQSGRAASFTLTTASGAFYPTAEWDTCSTALLTPSAAGQDMDQVLDASVGVKTLVNVGTVPFTVSNNVGSSPRAIRTPGAADITVAIGQSCSLVRDTSSADCWRAQLVGDPGALYAIPGLLKWHDSSVTSSILASGGNVVQWDDLSGNGYHDTVLTNGPAVVTPGPGVDFDVGNTEEMVATGFNVNTLLGSKEFIVIAEFSGTPITPKFGAANGTPRFYLEQTAFSYNTLNTITYTNAGTVRVWGHDGTNLFHRQDGSEVATTAVALSSLANSTWRTRAGIDGIVVRYAIFDASSWGGDYAANLAAAEAAFGV